MCTYFGKFLWEKSLFEICGWYNDKKNERKCYLYQTRRNNAISCFVSDAFRVSQRTIDVDTKKPGRATFKPPDPLIKR